MAINQRMLCKLLKRKRDKRSYCAQTKKTKTKAINNLSPRN